MFGKSVNDRLVIVMISSFLLAITSTYFINHVNTLSAAQAAAVFILSLIAVWTFYNVCIARLIKWPKVSSWGIIEIFLNVS